MEQIEQRISSREVAEMMEMEHKVLLRKIDGIIEDLAEHKIVLSKYWEESQYKDASGKSNREFRITKRGCEFLAHKSTGTKGNLFTDRYMDRFEAMKEAIEKPKQLSDREIMRIQLSMIDDVSTRVDRLENTMVIDYGQQRVLERLVNCTVVAALGGKESVAYKEVGKKVFSECNRDIKDRFDVNSRSNVPKVKFEEACEYIKKWQPCTNTKMLIEDCNAQGCFA